jgi:hypothetical protein
VVEGVEHLKEEGGVPAAASQGETETREETLELLLGDDAVRVVVHLPVELSEGSQVGLVLTHLEVKEGAQEI